MMTEMSLLNSKKRMLLIKREWKNMEPARKGVFNAKSKQDQARFNTNKPKKRDLKLSQKKPSPTPSSHQPKSVPNTD